MALRPSPPRRNASQRSCPHAQRIHRTKTALCEGLALYSTSSPTCRAGAARDYSKNIVVDEKDHPYTGTNYAWVRARTFGGKTTIWGRLALRLSDYDFKAASRDGYGEDWPISYSDIEPYYDRVDNYLGISGLKENLPHLPDSLFQRPNKLMAGEMMLRASLEKRGRLITPYRAGVTTDGLKHNKYRSKCYGRGACNRRVGRLRHSRRVRFAHGPDLSGVRHRQSDHPHQRHGLSDRHCRWRGKRRLVHRHGDEKELFRRRRKWLF